MCACNKQEVYYHISPWILKQMQGASPILSWLWNIRLGWEVLGVWNRKELKLTLVNVYFLAFLYVIDILWMIMDGIYGFRMKI